MCAPASTTNSEREIKHMKNPNILTTALFAAMTLTLPTATTAQATNDFGVMVMAHGGGDEWNAGVLELVAPLRADYPLEVAFGMADAASLQEAVEKLQANGVTDIAVVKLFISGESWHERTGQILGLVDGAPPRPAADSASHAHDEHSAHAAHGTVIDTAAAGDVGGHRMEFWRVDSTASFALSREGLAEAPETGEVLLDRALALSRSPANEDILILAHGPETEEENARWLQYMETHAEVLRSSGFNAVKTATLREDWPEKREAAEQEVRAFVAAANAAGRNALVIPFRVHGFGPYAETLEGLDYTADETGLIPHPAIARWVQRQVEALR